MAQFTMTIPDTLLPGILDSFATMYPIPEDDQDPPQPLYTQAEWAKMKLREYVRDIYRAYKANLDAETARTLAIIQSDLDTEGIDVA